jgi:hypothetical protein
MYKFKKASRMLAGLDDGERAVLDTICSDIRIAERDLLEAAQDILNDCGRKCRGLCCRNIHIDDIMTLLDCVHILATAPQMQAQVDTALKCEGLYSADCIFLNNGVGPCIFPDEVRPEKCIVSFCRGDGIVAAEIRQVRKGFNRLARFILLRKPRAVMRFLSGGLSGTTVARPCRKAIKGKAGVRSNR